MLIRPNRIRLAATRRLHAEAGFTLVELLVTMIVIASVLLGLIALQTRALVTTTQAKQRQQATAVGNQVLEQLRSLPYASLVKGMNPDALSSDPNIVGGLFEPGINTTISEVPVADNTGVTDRAPLAGPAGTNVTEVQDDATGSVTFEARSYVTRAASAPLDSPLWLSVIVSWSSSVTAGVIKSELFRSQAFSPSGCLSTNNRPFSGPCQAFLYGDASIKSGSLSVAGAGGLPVLTGAAAGSVSTSLVQVHAGIAAEQSVSVTGDATSSGAVSSVGQTVLDRRGEQRASTSAGDDYANLGTVPVKDEADLTQGNSAALIADGTYSALSLNVGVSDDGASFSGVTPTAAECVDLSGADTSGQPCASTWVRPDTLGVSLDLKEIAGRDLPSFDLGASAAAPGDSVAWGGRSVADPGADRCTTISGAGCVAAGVKRTLGAVTLGALPLATIGDAGAPFTDGMVTVTGYADAVAAEAGPSSTTVAATPSRVGAVRYRSSDPSGYSNLVLSSTTDTVVPLAGVSATYAAGSQSITVDIAGTLTVKPYLYTTVVPDADCKDACTKEATMPSVEVTLNYTVRLDGAPIETFDVKADLGASVATTSYKAAPSA